MEETCSNNSVLQTEMWENLARQLIACGALLAPPSAPLTLLPTSSSAVLTAPPSVTSSTSASLDSPFVISTADTADGDGATTNVLGDNSSTLVPHPSNLLAFLSGADLDSLASGGSSMLLTGDARTGYSIDLPCLTSSSATVTSSSLATVFPHVLPGLVPGEIRLPSTPASPSIAGGSGASTVSSLTSTHIGKQQTATAHATVIPPTPPTNMASNMIPKREPSSVDGSEPDMSRPPVPLCAICEADSTGIHFGVEACAACSAFFRRTVVLQKNYACTKGGECAVTKDSGGAQRCRACRFKKCIAVGMDRSAVQHRRDAIGKVSQIKLENSPGGVNDHDDMSSTAHQHQQHQQNLLNHHHHLMPSTSTTSSTPFMRSVLEEWIEKHVMLSKRRKLFYCLNSLEDAFDDVIGLYPAPREMSNFSECMYQLWRVEPRLIAEYVNSNAYTAPLPPSEKAALFKHFMLAFQAVEEPYLTWLYGGMERAWWVMPNRVYFDFDHVNTYFTSTIMAGLNLDMATAIRIFLPSFKNAMELIAKPMAAMGITYIEMIALSAIVYLDPMTPGIAEDTRAHIHRTRGQLTAALLAYYQNDMFKNGGMPESPEIRLANLVNISAGVRIHAERTRENMQILSLFEVIPCDNLFNEMCNIETAYSDDTRDKLRTRAVKEELVSEEAILAADIKWAEYKRLIEAGIIEKGTRLSNMKSAVSSKMMSRITAPVFGASAASPASSSASMSAVNDYLDSMKAGMSYDTSIASAVAAANAVAAAAAIKRERFEGLKSTKKEEPIDVEGLFDIKDDEAELERRLRKEKRRREEVEREENERKRQRPSMVDTGTDPASPPSLPRGAEVIASASAPPPQPPQLLTSTFVQQAAAAAAATAPSVPAPSQMTLTAQNLAQAQAMLAVAQQQQQQQQAQQQQSQQLHHQAQQLQQQQSQLQQQQQLMNPQLEVANNLHLAVPYSKLLESLQATTQLFQHQPTFLLPSTSAASLNPNTSHFGLP